MLCKRSHLFFVVFLLYIILISTIAFAQSDEEKNFLSMYFKEEELQVVSSTRSLKSISRVAENMTVVTAQDIERMNAHTLADVLNTVNGVQVWFISSTPGNNASAMIQGSALGHVTVLIDGIPQQNLGSNYTDLGIIPVQNIERIEIIKGPASSVWGSSLGGIINLITKNPVEGGLHGTASVSYGTRNTEDYRGEISGRKGDIGLYLSAGGIHSSGLSFGTDVMNKNLYSKLTYGVSHSTDISASGFYLKSHRDRGDFRDYDEMDRDSTEQYFGTVALNSRLSENIILDVTAYAQRQRVRISGDTISTSDLLFSFVSDDRRYGGSAKLTWKLESQTAVLGYDYNYGTELLENLIDGKQNLTRWAVFGNDTIVFGNLAIIPGLRYESTNQNGDFLSPSLGATYNITKKTILRATVSRGFNIPALGDTFGSGGGGFANPDLKVEKVMSYQVGAESGELKYIWVKVSLFRHDLKDVLESVDSDGDGFVDKTVNQGRQRRQGFETEIKTLPVYNTTFSAGTTYIYAKDRDTGQIIKRIPKYTYDVALSYDDMKSFRALLKGRYIWWNAEDFTKSKYASLVFDVNVTNTLFRHKEQVVEVFATAHNLFNNNQYMAYFYRNSSRWYEGGLRYKF